MKKYISLMAFAMMTVFISSLVACEETEEEESQDNPVVPVNPGDYQTVPVTGGTIEKGDIAITFPSATFDQDQKVAVTEVKKGTMAGELEQSLFYQITLPQSSNKPFTVKMKSDKTNDEVGLVVFSYGCITSSGNEIMPAKLVESTYSNGEYTATIPAFDKSNSHENTNIVVGLKRIPDDTASSARKATRANNSVIGKEGNVNWVLTIDYGNMEKYSLNYRTIEAQLPQVNICIKEAIRSIHALGFKVPDGTTLNYYVSSFTSVYDKWVLPGCYGCFFASRVSTEYDAIYLKDVLLLDSDLKEQLKQTIIHETLHNYQSYYYPWSINPYPSGNWNAMFEMGSVWIEKIMNNGEPNGKYQFKDGGIVTTFTNHYRLGIPRSSSDVKELFTGTGRDKASDPYAEMGYAMGPLLHYMISQNYKRGYQDSVVVSLYESHWGKIETAKYCLIDVLDDWYTSTFKEKFFDGTDRINDYYLSLWKGELMSEFGINNLTTDNIMNEKNGVSKISLEGKVYPYGCEGQLVYFNGFKDSLLTDNELVVKQEAEGLKTYLLYTKSSRTYLHPQVATKGDSIVMSGAELEALRKKGYATTSNFFLLTVRENSSLTDTEAIPSKESIELRKTSTDLKMTDVTGLDFKFRIETEDSGKTGESSGSASIYSFDDFTITQKGSTVHLEFTRFKDETDSGGSTYVTRELSFDITGFSSEPFKDYRGLEGRIKIENLTFLEYEKYTYSESSPYEYSIKEIQLGVSTMHHSYSEKGIGRFHFAAQRSTLMGLNWWNLDAFSYKSNSKARGKAAVSHDYKPTGGRDDLISLSLSYDYTGYAGLTE